MKRMITVMILLVAAVGVTGSTAWAVQAEGNLSKNQVKTLIRTAMAHGEPMRWPRCKRKWPKPRSDRTM
jgi:hypothetical protein